MHSVVICIDIPVRRDGNHPQTNINVLAFENRLEEVAKTIPGCSYVPRGLLLLPLDSGLTVVGLVVEEAKKFGFPVRMFCSDSEIRERVV